MNTKPKFTPGPWSIEELEDYDLGGTMGLKSPSGPIGEVYEKEDAALISAAPEMYAALRDYEEAIEEIYERCDATTKTRLLQASMLSRESLKKAEGL